MDEIMVSICCLVYNHEKYLRKCLDGFIMQKTNFKYEMLIHDDASTDGSADIIREYEAKYPDIIKPIYQTENQYSKGVKISWKYQYPRAKGKYIALCEGDDYWTSKYKIQRQFDYMESHPEMGLCVHQVARYDEMSNCYSLQTDHSSDKDYTVDEVILGGGGLFGTNSIFLRTRNLLAMPSCFDNKYMEDFQLVLYSTICGGCHYFRDVLSVYRTGVVGSFTDRHKNNIDMQIGFCKEKLRMLSEIDQYYHYKYSDSLNKNASVTQHYLNLYLEEKAGKASADDKPITISFKERIKKRFPDLVLVHSLLKSIRIKRLIKRGNRIPINMIMEVK